jgi:hypothetical protein
LARRRSQDELRRKKREFVHLWKSQHGCEDCGEHNPVVLDFDHWEDNKEAPVWRLVRDNASWDRIRSEMEKCAVVCANCHRIRTARRSDRWVFENGETE